MKSKKENTSRRDLIKNRVLVFNVNAPRRPIVLPLGKRTLVSGESASLFGIETCEKEAHRRSHIYSLMTDDEREVFDKYCGLRDDE